MPFETFDSINHPTRKLHLTWGEDDARLVIRMNPLTSDEPQNLWELVKDVDPEYRDSFDHLYFELDSRDKFNSLIRALRRARDRIYGKDE